MAATSKQTCVVSVFIFCYLVSIFLTGFRDNVSLMQLAKEDHIVLFHFARLKKSIHSTSRADYSNTEFPQIT